MTNPKESGRSLYCSSRNIKGTPIKQICTEASVRNVNKAYPGRHCACFRGVNKCTAVSGREECKQSLSWTSLRVFQGISKCTAVSVRNVNKAYPGQYCAYFRGVNKCTAVSVRNENKAYPGKHCACFRGVNKCTAVSVRNVNKAYPGKHCACLHQWAEPSCFCVFTKRVCVQP